MAAVKGLAAMSVAGKGPKAKAEETKPKPSGSAKLSAIKEAVAALEEGDSEGAAKALEVAIKACVAEYEG